MRRIVPAVAALMFLAMPNAAKADAFGGLWLTENGKAVVELAPCPEQSICGSIYWLREDAKQYDYMNPDPELRQRPLCGLKFMGGFRPDGLAAWEGGSIYKIDDGDTYHAEMSINDDGTLHLRGHIGVSFIGKSQTWTRVNPAQYKRCEGPVGAFDPALARKDTAKKAGSVNE